MPDLPTPIVVLSTLPPDRAADIARTLVTEKLAACVNLVPQVRSIYTWNDALCDEAETLAVIKTTHERYQDLANRLVELHPYDVPEVLPIAVAGGHAPYLEWLAAAVR